MGSKPKAPKIEAPDPVLAAKLQQSLGMFGQRNPYQTLRYEKTGETPEGISQYDIVQEFTPEQQELFNRGMGLKKDFLSALEGAIEQAPTTLDYSKLQSISGIDPESMRENYSKYVEYFRPEMEDQAERQRAKLFSQGFGMGSEVQSQHQQNVGKQWNNLLFNAEEKAWNRAAQQRNEERLLRNQQISEFLQQQQQPFNVVRQLGGLIPQQDATFQMADTNGLIPDFMRAQENQLAQRNATAQQKYARQMQDYQQQQALLGTGASILGTIGGTLIGGPLGGQVGGALGSAFGSIF